MDFEFCILLPSRVFWKSFFKDGACIHLLDQGISRQMRLTNQLPRPAHPLVRILNAVFGFWGFVNVATRFCKPIYKSLQARLLCNIVRGLVLGVWAEFKISLCCFFLSVMKGSKQRVESTRRIGGKRLLLSS